MIRGKSQGSLPKAEGVITFYTPRNKPSIGLGGTWSHRAPGPGEWGSRVLGTMHGAAKPSGAAVEFCRVKSTDVKGLCLWGVQKPQGHCWAVGLGHQGSPVSRDSKQAPAHWPLGAALFASQPAWQVCLGEELAYKPSMCSNKWPFPEPFLWPSPAFQDTFQMQLAPLHCQF